MPEAQEDEVVHVVTGDGTTLAVNKLVAYKSALLKKIIRRKAVGHRDRLTLLMVFSASVSTMSP